MKPLKHILLLLLITTGLFPLNQIYSQAPQANPDTTGVCLDGVVTINVLANDEDSSGLGIVLEDIIIEPLYGDVTYSSDGTVEYTPDGVFVGTDILIYEIKDGAELSDISTLTIYVQDAAACVWPGDADDNGIANNLDLLYVGLFYGNIGPSRYTSEIEWNSNYCDAWDEEVGVTIPLNPKFADCNGDGFVDANDTVPILENYGELHLKTTEISGGGDTLPPLSIAFFTDSIEVGSTVVLPIILGSIDYPATNILGVAFTLEYNPDFIVDGSISINFNTGWLKSDSTDIISLNRDDTTGNLAASVVRINHTSATGYGPIGTVSFVMEDNIAGKITDMISSVFTMCPTFPELMNDAGEIRGAETMHLTCDSVIVYQIFNDIPDFNTTNIHIYPNPVSNYLFIEPDMQIDKLELMDMYGKTLISFNNVSNVIEIDIREFTSGVYLLKIQKNHTLLIEKIIIQHN
ncbi:MAG: T9SS type A sorting domain-containing protein [Chitinophagales bacterium]|nr:T9SS type A sorting domain-containing protein [Bacteroidota bacterium]MBP7398969.1 T9SS type A sorting domain-containing protein [Chitinophagales bacterium]MBP8753844.1 T9SS type A sorting domain-containing protein [Chitinophagales bacterium]MBP9704890.1 T9SS type A sorting domain-containing protein [Chitinophagales bacterium]